MNKALLSGTLENGGSDDIFFHAVRDQLCDADEFSAWTCGCGAAWAGRKNRGATESGRRAGVRGKKRERGICDRQTNQLRTGSGTHRLAMKKTSPAAREVSATNGRKRHWARTSRPGCRAGRFEMAFRRAKGREQRKPEGREFRRACGGRGGDSRRTKLLPLTTGGYSREEVGWADKKRTGVDGKR